MTSRRETRGAAEARIALLPAAGLAVIAWLAFGAVADEAPAFDETLRHETVFGDWRIEAGEAHFDRSAYDFHVGYGYLRGDVAALIMGAEGISGTDAFETALLRARDMFRRSTAYAPGNVDAWTNLAWVQFLLGDAGAAEIALVASWNLAPFSASEAPDRLDLVAGLDAVFGRDLAGDPATGTAVSRDLAVLRAYAPRLLDGLPDSMDQRQ